MNQEERSQRSQAPDPRGRARPVLAPGLPRDQHSRHRGARRRVDGQRLPPLQGQGDDLQGPARPVLDGHRRPAASPSTSRWRRARSPTTSRQIGFAARDMVVKYRRHIALIYVDVVEFDGHPHPEVLRGHGRPLRALRLRPIPAARSSEARLRDGVCLGAGLMLATRFFMNYFAVEVLFGVANHFGQDSDRMVTIDRRRAAARTARDGERARRRWTRLTPVDALRRSGRADSRSSHAAAAGRRSGAGRSEDPQPRVPVVPAEQARPSRRRATCRTRPRRPTGSRSPCGTSPPLFSRVGLSGVAFRFGAVPYSPPARRRP